MDPASFILKSLAVLVLVGINAYFVAAEFALVAVRRTRIEQRVRGGDRAARHVLDSMDHPEDFISAAQLGITSASIGIGYISESTIAQLLLPYLQWANVTFGSLPVIGSVTITAHLIATLITLGLVTYLHVVLGEQVPKMIAIQRAEPVALWTVGPTQLFGRVLRPFIRFMSGSAGVITRMLGVPPTGVHAVPHTPEEIRLLVEQSQEEGQIEAEQEQMIAGVFDFPDIMAREVMTPRRDIKALEVTSSLEEVLHILIEEGHSRMPVYEGDLDQIVGVLLAKDLLPYLVGSKGEGFNLRDVMREPYFVPDTKPLGELMTEMRSENVHLVIVIDEFGALRASSRWKTCWRKSSATSTTSTMSRSPSSKSRPKVRSWWTWSQHRRVNERFQMEPRARTSTPWAATSSARWAGCRSRRQGFGGRLGRFDRRRNGGSAGDQGEGRALPPAQAPRKRKR
jgi:CBS domain containing-hemolysin-like protein